MPSRLDSSSTSARSSERGRRGVSRSESEQVGVGARVETAEQREQLVADQPPLRIRVGRVDAHRQAALAAVVLGLLAGDVEQRPHHAVLAAHLDATSGSARDDPVQHRLDLIGGRVTCGAQATALGGQVAEVAHRRLGRRGLDPDDLGSHQHLAVARVRVGGAAAHAVMHVDGADAVAELAERVPEAGRVGTAGDEAGDLAAGRDQVMRGDEPLDACGQLVHAAIVTEATTTRAP